LSTLQDLKDAYVFWKEDGDESELRRVIRPMENGCLFIFLKIILRDNAVGCSLFWGGFGSFWYQQAWMQTFRKVI